jgi:hypothetical protein
MKKYIIGFMLALSLFLFIAATTDHRNWDDRYPVAKISISQLSWVSGDANSASTTLSNINGMIERIDIVVSDSNQAPANVCTVLLEDDEGTDLAYFANVPMTPATRTMKLATSDSTDFDAIPCCGNIVVTVDPNVGPTGVMWTFDMVIFVE